MAYDVDEELEASTNRVMVYGVVLLFAMAAIPIATAPHHRAISIGRLIFSPQAGAIPRRSQRRRRDQEGAGVSRTDPET